MDIEYTQQNARLLKAGFLAPTSLEIVRVEYHYLDRLSLQKPHRATYDVPIKITLLFSED